MVNLKFPKITAKMTIARLITSAAVAYLIGKAMPLTVEQFASLFVIIWIWLFIYGYVNDVVDELL